MTRREHEIEQELRDIKKALDESTTIVVTDLAGRITYVNDKFCEMSQYSRAELLGATPRIVNSGHHPKEFFRDLWETIGAGRTWRGEIRNRAKDGGFYWVSTTIVPFLDAGGRPHHFIAVLHDVTASKEAEQVIVEKNQLLEQTYDAIFIWNLDDGILEWNQNAEKLYGYARAEALGRTTHELLQTVYPHSFRAFMNEIRRRGYWEGELVHKTKAGDEVIVESRLHVIRRDGENVVVLETLRDITGRKQLETKLARASQLSLVGELAAGLAHEIKNPLAGIKGVIDILLRRRAPEDDEREVLASVQQEIERIDRTVRTLLRQARPRPLAIRLESINETVRRAVRFASYQNGVRHANGGRTRTRLELPDAVLLVAHDVAGVEDALLNLILNARAAVRERAHGEITVRLGGAEGAGEVTIEVADNGDGIAPEKLAQIFVPFYTTSENGTGLGLAAVKRIARAHGGSCDVRSEVGKGSTFTLRLPYDPAPSKIVAAIERRA